MNTDKITTASPILPLIDGVVVGLMIFFISLVVALTVQTKASDAIQISANNQIKNIATLGASILKDPEILPYFQAQDPEIKANSEMAALEALHVIADSSNAIESVEIYALLDKKTHKLAEIVADNQASTSHNIMSPERIVSNSGLNSALRLGRSAVHMDKTKGFAPVLWAYAPITGTGNKVVAAVGVKHTMNSLGNYLYFGGLGIAYSPLSFASFLGLSSGILVCLIRISRSRYFKNFGVSKEQLAYLANHDTITGLPNKKGMLIRMQRSISRASRKDERLLIMHIDFIYPHTQNEALINVSSNVMKEIAERLNEQLREYDTVARLEYQQFLVVIEGLPKQRDIAPMLTRILDSLEDVYYFDDSRLSPKVYAGIALYPDSGEDTYSLLKCAELGLHHAKKHGVREHFFQQPIPKKSTKRKR